MRSCAEMSIFALETHSESNKNALLEKREALAKQQENISVQQRKIDMLFSGRVAQIRRNLEEDQSAIQERKKKMNTIASMAALT
jgi:hypothetical protein